MRISDWSSDVCSSDLVTSRIEDAVSSIDSVDYFESVSSSGLSTVTVTFKSGVDSAAAVAEVRAQVETLVDQLPTDVLTPVVTQLSIDAAPILRSEEHTSELQSLMRISYAVFCLKKTHNPSPPPYTTHR